MARSDYSRYDDEPRRSQGGLSLSTGRFDGRSTGTTRSSSSSGNRPRGTRHNPLRDEYPSSRDRRREPEPGRRHSGGERSTRGEQPRGKQTPAGNRGAQGRPRNGAPSGRGSHAPRAGAAFAPQMHTLAPSSRSWPSCPPTRQPATTLPTSPGRRPPSPSPSATRPTTPANRPPRPCSPTVPS